MTRKMLIGILSITGLLQSCATKLYDEESRFHQIAADKYGNYNPLYSDGEGSHPSFEGLNAHLHSILEKIKQHPAEQNGRKKILIFVHGGLNGIDDNYERLLLQQKSLIKDNYYPIFISWRSGAFTTIKDRYFRVRNGIDRPWWVTYPSMPFYLLSDLLKGVASIPEAFWDQGANFVTTHSKRLKYEDEHDLLCHIDKFKDHTNLYYSRSDNKKSLLEKAGYAARQVVPGVARLITTPAIEGIGDDAWNMMLRRAKLLTYRQYDLTWAGDFNPKLNERSCGELPYCAVNGANGVVSQLMRALAKNKDAYDIMLVGHSMGAIIANDIVSEFPQLHFNKIIHMASADSIRNLIEKTLPYVKAQNTNRNFYNLMLHPTNEEQEQSVLGFAPEGSLLIWLDYMLTNPETTLDRRAGRWENIKWTLPFLGGNNMHFKVFGLRRQYQYECPVDNPKKCQKQDPIIHGGFGSYPFWKEEFYWYTNDSKVSIPQADIDAAKAYFADKGLACTTSPYALPD